MSDHVRATTLPLMLPDPRLVGDVRRIAVLRATALGDYVFALPALDALRIAYPAAEIVLLGRSWHAAFLTGRPGPVDRVIALPERLPADDRPELPPGERDAILRPIAAERFDLAIQLHGGGRHSNGVVLALGARLTAGSRTPDAPALDRFVPYAYYQPEVFRNLEIVGLVGARAASVEPVLAVTDGDRAALERDAPTLAGSREPIAVLHPGASDPRRRWPPAWFAAVGDRLARAGVRVAVTGTGPEASIVADVVGAMRAPALDLAGRLDLPAMTALLERASVVVSNDTGPLHLAAAVGSATVGIYWCGNVINAGPPFRSRHRLGISWRLECPVCGIDCTRASCGHRVSFVADVPPDEVAAHALELLDLPATTSQRVPAVPVS